MKTIRGHLTRRKLLKATGASLAAGSLLSACGDDEPSPVGGSSDAGTVADLGSTADAGVSADGGTDAGATADAQAAVDLGTTTEAWATGGTAAMTAAASYPNPFTSGLAEDTCALTCQLTLGPCYAPTAPVRRDVSEGIAGVPVRLALRVVEADSTCTPVVGAELEIWHCNIEGLYSGNDVNQGNFCTGGDAAAQAAYFARGRAITDDDGVAYFDTTFPGWYSSRAVHIHFLVRRAAYVGGVQDTNASVVSQLFFPETLTAEIFADVAGYQSQGQPDTTFATDTVIGGADATPYVVGYGQMSDGAMLAWKTIAVSDSSSC